MTDYAPTKVVPLWAWSQ